SWGVQLGSTDNSNDHNFISIDVAGGLSPSSAFSESDFKLVPEPSMGLLALAAFGLLAGRRPRRRAA
ncbi:MAG: hypothetical protein GX595_08265, partial [Lentisphaerae bacterium]|nr:hypothetical protein [Lentisphaerota bacterium]